MSFLLIYGWVDGGAGDDILLTGLGNDVVYASTGFDTINTGQGHDKLIFGDYDVFVLGNKQKQ